MSICDPNTCTSCMACYNACIRNCIKMNYNNSNNIEPYIDENLCAHCNLCSRICPENNPVKRNHSIEAYACWNLNNLERQSSSSGGIASIFYAHFIENKLGTAFGCSYDENLKLKFSRADNLDELEKYKTSKYSQAYIGNIYQDVLYDLKKDKYVIFIGTPCQVSGLKNFLRKDYEKLLTIDLICHGVASQIYLDDYIKALNLNQKPDKLTFRGFHDFCFTLYSNDKVIYSKDSNEDLFYRAFLSGLNYRENCYNCKYASIERVGDITIGDFWGLGSKTPFNGDTKNGVSLVLLNNLKGIQYFNEIKEKIFFEKRSIEEAVEGNHQLSHPTSKHINHDKFLELYKTKGILEALKQSLT